MIDDFDRKILQLLQENSRYKNTEIAEKLGFSEGAVRKRIAKLVENGIIERFTIQLNEKAAGVWSVVHVYISGTAATTDVRKEIIKRVDKGLDTVFETAGEIDLMCVFHTMNEEDLKVSIEKIRRIEGVKNTKTYWVLQRTKLPSDIF